MLLIVLKRGKKKWSTFKRFRRTLHRRCNLSVSFSF